MYNNIVRLGSYRYLEMIQHFTRILDALYPFSIRHRHLEEKVPFIVKMKRKTRLHKPSEEEKSRKQEEEDRVREEKEFFSEIERIREKEHHGI